MEALMVVAIELVFAFGLKIGWTEFHPNSGGIDISISADILYLLRA
jgi:hypothetical protein